MLSGVIPTCGDRLPHFEATCRSTSSWFSLYEHAAGTPLAVVVRPVTDGVVEGVRIAMGRVDGRTLTIGVRNGSDALVRTDVRHGWPASSGSLLDVDVDAAVVDQCGGPGTVIVTGPDLRIVAVGTGPGVADELPPPRPGIVRSSATPIVVVSDVVPSNLSDELIEWFESHDHHVSGDVRVGQPGPDLVVKAQRDRRLRDPDLASALTKVVADRVLPEVARCFAAQPTSFEAFKIVRYNTGNGRFPRHRANTAADAAHRRFALTLNLNDGYEGGNLVFPEFGRDEYRAAAGGAVVFSGNLLHGATDVVAGTRYAAVSFLW
jgi:2OG-Fe(II) oxygenase superfamily